MWCKRGINIHFWTETSTFSEQNTNNSPSCGYEVLSSFSVVVITAEEEATIEIKISADAVNQGESFTVDCIIHNIGYHFVSD